MNSNAKKDVLRIFRILSSLRKGLFWTNFIMTQRLEYECTSWRNLKLFHQAQAESNTFLQVFILLTTVFLALLGLSNELPFSLNIPIVTIVYLALVSIIGIFSTFRYRRFLSQLSKGEMSFEATLKSQIDDLLLSDKKDELLTSLTELKLVDEIVEAFNASKNLGEKHTQIENIRELLRYAKEVERKINNLKKEIGQAEAQKIPPS